MPRNRTPMPIGGLPRDHAIASHAKLETAARSASEALVELNSIGIPHPAIAELIKASSSLAKALAHVRVMIARMP